MAQVKPAAAPVVEDVAAAAPQEVAMAVDAAASTRTLTLMVEAVALDAAAPVVAVVPGEALQKTALTLAVKAILAAAQISSAATTHSCSALMQDVAAAEISYL